MVLASSMYCQKPNNEQSHEAWPAGAGIWSKRARYMVAERRSQITKLLLDL